MNVNYEPSPWMRYTLVAAGIYNLAWGAGAIFFPETMLTWLGVEFDVSYFSEGQGGFPIRRYAGDRPCNCKGAGCPRRENLHSW